MIKKSKHIFASEYPQLTIDECTHLVKLTTEANAIFQVINPYYYLPAVRWLKSKLTYPTYLEITWFTRNPVDLEHEMRTLLLMLKDTTGIHPRKANALSFKAEECPGENEFYNLHLQFKDASIVNLKIAKIAFQDEFKIDGYSENLFFSLNFPHKSFMCNHSPIDLKPFPALNEIDVFMDVAHQKNLKTTRIEDYLAVIQLIQKITKKINQFSRQ